MFLKGLNIYKMFLSTIFWITNCFHFNIYIVQIFIFLNVKYIFMKKNVYTYHMKTTWSGF